MVLILWNFSILSSKSPWTSKRRCTYSMRMTTLLVRTAVVFSQWRQTPFQLTGVVSAPRSCPDLRPAAPTTFHNPSLHSTVNLSSFLQWLRLGFWKWKEVVLQLAWPNSLSIVTWLQLRANSKPDRSLAFTVCFFTS